MPGHVLDSDTFALYRFAETASGNYLNLHDTTNQQTVSAASLAASPKITNGKNGTRYARVFDGVDDVMVMSTSFGARSAQLQVSWTWEAFVRLDAAGAHAIMAYSAVGENLAENAQMSIEVSAGLKLQAFWETGSGVDTTVTQSAGAAMVVGQWHHVAIAKNHTAKTVAFYLDGVLQDTVSYTNNPNGGTNSNWVVGGNLPTPTVRFTGAIKDISISSTVRTPTEVAAHAALLNTTLFVVNDAGTLWQWRCSEEPDAVDESDRGFHLHMTGTPGVDILQGAASLISGDGRSKWHSGVARLESPPKPGPNNLAFCAMLKGSWTFECWFRLSDTSSTDRGLFVFGDSASETALNNMFGFELVNPGTGFRSVSESGTGVDATYSPGTLLTSPLRYQRNHLAVVKEGAGATYTLKVYLNGVLKFTSGTFTQYSGGEDGTLKLGLGPGGTLWQGNLEEVHFSKVARSASYIQADYLRGTVDRVDPVVTDMSPASGTGLGTLQPVSFTARNDGDDGNILVAAEFPGAKVTELVWDGAEFLDPYKNSQTQRAQLGTSTDFRYDVRRTGGWKEAPSMRIFSQGGREQAAGEANPDPQFTIPPSLAAGKMICYYPPTSDPQYASSGIQAEIAFVHSFNRITVKRPFGTAEAIRGATNFTNWGDPGTFTRLDTRHRPRIRWHLSYGETFADNLIADPSLISRYGWDAYDYDLVIQNLPTQEAVFDRTLDKYRQLGFNVSFGLLPIGAAHPAPDDPTNGILSIWCNRDFWEMWGAIQQRAWDIGGSRLDGWFHNQMEEAFSEQALAVNVLAAGRTREDVREAMSPYTSVIAAHGAPVIQRPMNLEDWGMLAILEAGAWGSMYCSEDNGFSGLQYRHSKFNWQATLGQSNTTWGRLRNLMPAHCFPCHLQYETSLRMYGRRVKRDYAQEDAEGRYPIVELTTLNEQNGAINVPQIGKTNWWRVTTIMNPPLTGNKRSSVNDVFQWWCVWAQPEDGQLVPADDACGTAHDGVAGSGGPSDLRPWQRQVTPSVDSVNNNIPFDPLGRGWQTLKDSGGATANTRADCYRLDVGSSGGSFSLRFRAILPLTPPGPGVIWGLWGIVAENGRVANMVWNGTTGNIELRVANGASEQIFTYLAAPAGGTDMAFVISYDLAASATGKWWTPAAGWVTPTQALINSNIAHLIGGTHDLLNRTTVVWGCPNLVLPFDSDICYWLRALTDDEITCVRDLANRMPVGTTLGV